MAATVHTVPSGDLYPHLDSVSCPCVPTLGSWYDEDREYTWKVVLHRSWDRREEAERERDAWPFAMREGEA